MKIAFIHPLKHHAYHSFKGVIDAFRDNDTQVIGYFGYYNRGDFIDRLLSKTRFKTLADGWKYDPVTNYVSTSLYIKVLFLLHKVTPGLFGKPYFNAYQRWVIRNLKDVDCIHVLQDYCNEIIRYAKKNGVKIVYEQIIAFNPEQFYSPGAEDTNKLEKERENLRNSDLIIMGSEFVEKSLAADPILSKSDIKAKMRIIPYGVDVKQFSYERKAYKNGPLNLLTVAECSKRKGIDLLLDVMGEFDDEQVSLTLIGITKEQEEGINKQIKSSRNNVNHIGVVPHEKIQAYYKKCHLFVLPSLAEGSALVIYEAMGSGCPCIVTDNCGSVISNHNEGVIIRAGDKIALKNAIIYFMEHPDMVEVMSENARKTVDKYTWDMYEKNIKSLYETKFKQH